SCVATAIAPPSTLERLRPNSPGASTPKRTGARDEHSTHHRDLYISRRAAGRTAAVVSLRRGHRRRRIFKVYRRTTRYITVSGLEQDHCTRLTNIDAAIDSIVAQHHIADNTKKEKITNGNGFDDIDNLIRNSAPETQRSEAFARCVWSLAGQGLT